MSLSCLEKTMVFALAALLMSPLAAVASHAGERESGGRRAPQAIQIDFNSPGNGIDSATLDQVLALANDEIRSAKLELLTVKPWGREGERTLCLQFADVFYVRTVFARIQEVVKQGNTLSGFNKTSAKLALNCTGEQPKPHE
jgi:hypothetical protein